MPAEITVRPDGTITRHFGETYSVEIGIQTVIVVADPHQAEWFARRLNMARESKLHTAMNILTEQLGWSEEYAKYVYHLLLTDGATQTLN
jgi:hypothetical protein